jgi:hypothetical protein
MKNWNRTKKKLLKYCYWRKTEFGFEFLVKKNAWMIVLFRRIVWKMSYRDKTNPRKMNKIFKVFLLYHLNVITFSLEAQPIDKRKENFLIGSWKMELTIKMRSKRRSYAHLRNNHRSSFQWLNCAQCVTVTHSYDRNFATARGYGKE